VKESTVADITIHNLAPETKAALAAVAERRGVALEDVAREALDEAATKADRAALLARIDRIRAMTLKPYASESGEMLSRIRQERSDHLAGR
jgi:hypothetical protein